ncbi:MAG: hypothetical protein J6B02_00630 [Selenomonadales bacterium]|nr:hypothetical protein [Selenomonadales bacterium]
MDNLAEIAVWYAVENQKESFALKDFAAEDVMRAKRYLGTSAGVDAVENKSRQTARDTVNVDPLAVAGGFDDDDDAPADPLEQDVFETDEEYAERIAQIESIHVGYAILDMRKGDGYTNIHFLQHHLDKNRRVRFTQSPVYFFVDQAEQDLVIDGELVAKLRVHNNEVYCDYSHVFLRSDGEDIPVQVICWDKIGYENEADYQTRIEALPILPLALCKPIRS